MSNIAFANVECYKAIIFCYEKNFDKALKHINDSLNKVADNIRESYHERVKSLIDKIQNKLLKKESEIDMSYIPDILKKPPARKSIFELLKLTVLNFFI